MVNRVHGCSHEETVTATDQLSALAELIATAPLNLVSKRDRARVGELHVPESVAVTAALNIPPGRRVLDLGSGGGLPGLVLAVLRPDVTVVCLDARAKKMRFVVDTAGQLGLENVSVLAERAEMSARNPQQRERFDVVISRALASAAVVAELGRGFLRPGGWLHVVKSERYEDEVPTLRRVRGRLGYGRPRVIDVPDAPRPTWLVQLRAAGACPRWVPRKDGVPQQDPLGGN
jgi:16S rRNA (guanine527-N7)-methyltransferase